MEGHLQGLSFAKVSSDILRVLTPPGKRYILLLGGMAALLLFGAYAWLHQIYTGMGVAGITHPVKWGIYITNFVFWVGLAHSGTLISAILYLFRASWRTSIHRSAEAMTIFALMTAGTFPLIHLGRVWYFYWLLPYPNQRGLWVNFRSPLIWDVFAVGTYFLVSLMFFYTGLIPDLAAARDAFRGWRRKLYGILSLGWQGSDREWRHYRAAYLFMAGLATPLVISVHSVVSWDFAMSIVPGWHSTIFAPYFVAGAIFSGSAMVITLLVPLRKLFRLEEYITLRHFENLAKVIIFTSLIVTYSYANEFFIAWYTGNVAEQESFSWRAFGHYAPLFWSMVVCNSALPLAFFFRRVRRNIASLFIISILINVGMWLERFVIIVTSLAHEYAPYGWGHYSPSWVEIGITAGSFALFFFLFGVFVKLFPVISITEVREQLHASEKEVAAP